MTLIYRCPQCGFDSAQTKMEYVRLKSGDVAIMCWDECGFDTHVNGMWFFLNSWRDE